MAKYRVADSEMDVVSFGEFKENIGDYQDLEPRASGENCFILKMPDGSVYFSKDEYLVTTAEDKNVIIPKSTFEADFIKI